MITAKMYVRSRQEQSDASGEKISEQVDLDAVYGDDDPDSENSSFSRYTPSASLHIFITNPNAFEQLVPGRSYYVDIREA